MIDRMKAFHALTKLFFGENSFPEQGLRKLINLCDSNKDVLRTKLYLDDMFIAKFLFLIDDRMYQWLKQCCRVSSIRETNILLMDYSQLFYDLQSNRFFCVLPQSITKVISNPVKDPKKRKQVETITNKSQAPEWKLKQDEKWDVIFKGKTNDGPTLSYGCKPCLKYHVKGVCFSDCKHLRSHCILAGNDKKKTNEYIKSLRGD